MKRILYAVLATGLPILLGACDMPKVIVINGGGNAGGPTTVGSGKRASETRSVSAFHRVSLAGSGQMTVTVGAPQRVTVEMDDNLLKLVKTTVKDGELTVDTEGSYRSDKGLVVTISVPSLDGADLSGSGSITATGVHGSRFKASISGSGDLTASGSADTASVTIDGSGNADLSKLAAKTVSADVADSGTANVDATDTLNATIAGSGDIVYSGHPHIQSSVTGSGSVRQK